jgi:hypothetical protein
MRWMPGMEIGSSDIVYGYVEMVRRVTPSKSPLQVEQN